MKFELRKASTIFNSKETVEINTLEELEALDEKYGNHSLIIEFGSIPEIIIYDDYVE